MEDPLSQYRKQPPKGAATPNAKATALEAEKRLYEAYDKKGKPSPYLEIRCVVKPSQAPQSRYLMAVVYSADFDDAFTLLYSFMAVEVKGRKLKDIRRTIQHSQCEFIQEFHENDFLKPATGEPVITSIHFITGEKLDDILSTYQKGS